MRVRQQEGAKNGKVCARAMAAAQQGQEGQQGALQWKVGEIQKTEGRQQRAMSRTHCGADGWADP